MSSTRMSNSRDRHHRSDSVIARKALAILRGYWDFLGAFASAHRTIGAVAPTSHAVAERMTRLAGIPHVRTVAELGPGTGPITRSILAALPSNGRLWAFEVYEPFLEQLRASIDDPRFTLLARSAEDVNAIRQEDAAAAGGFDAIISSVPFSLMEPEQTRAILREAGKALGPDGVFVALQYHPRYLAPYLRDAFETVERSVYPWNVPPVLLLRARHPRRQE